MIIFLIYHLLLLLYSRYFFGYTFLLKAVFSESANTVM